MQFPPAANRGWQKTPVVWRRERYSCTAADSAARSYFLAGILPSLHPGDGAQPRLPSLPLATSGCRREMFFPFSDSLSNAELPWSCLTYLIAPTHPPPQKKTTSKWNNSFSPLFANANVLLALRQTSELFFKGLEGGKNEFAPEERETEQTPSCCHSYGRGICPLWQHKWSTSQLVACVFAHFLIVEQVKEVKCGLFPFLGCLWGSLTSKEHIIFQKTLLKRILYHT